MKISYTLIYVNKVSLYFIPLKKFFLRILKELNPPNE